MKNRIVKSLIMTVAVAALAWLLSFFLPYWSLALAGFVGGFVFRLGGIGRDFSAAFFGGFLFWFVYGMLILGTNSPLFERVGGLLPGNPKGFMLAFIGGVLAGLLAGFGALTGATLKGLTGAKN